VEPGNQQVLSLQSAVKDKLKEGMYQCIMSKNRKSFEISTTVPSAREVYCQ